MDNIIHLLSSKYSLLILIIIGFIYNIIVYQNKFILIIMFFIIIYIFNLYDLKNKFKNEEFKTIDEFKKKNVDDLLNKALRIEFNDKRYKSGTKNSDDALWDSIWFED